MKSLRHIFKNAVIGLAAFGTFALTGCDSADFRAISQKITKEADQLEASFPGPRQKAMIEALADNEMAVYRSTYGGGRQLSDYEQRVDSRFVFLIDNHINIRLTENLPQGAIVQVFKDSILVDSQSPEDVQTLAFEKTVDYMSAQIRDRQPYGTGETFTLSTGNLVRTGKFSQAYEKILVPATPQGR